MNDISWRLAMYQSYNPINIILSQNYLNRIRAITYQPFPEYQISCTIELIFTKGLGS